MSGSNEIQYVNPYFTSKMITFPGLKIRSTDNNLTFDLSFNAEFFDGYTHTDPFGGDDNWYSSLYSYIDVNFDYTETMYYSVVNISNEGIYSYPDIVEISGNNINFNMFDLVGDDLNIDIIFSVRSTYETIQYLAVILLYGGDRDIRSTTIPITTGSVINIHLKIFINNSQIKSYIIN